MADVKRKENTEREKIINYLSWRGWQLAPKSNPYGDVYQLNMGSNIARIVVKYTVDKEEYMTLVEAINSIEQRYKNVRSDMKILV